MSSDSPTNPPSPNPSRPLGRRSDTSGTDDQTPESPTPRHPTTRPRTTLDRVQVLPLVALRDTVIFPEMIVPLQVGRDRSVKALDRAVRTSQPVALVTQRSNEKEEISSADELYGIGTLAKIAQVIRLQDGTIRAIVQGQRRIRLLDLLQTDPHLEARVELIDETEKTLEVEALMASVQGQIEQYVSSGASVPPEVAVAARNIADGGLLADMVAYSPDMTTEQRQQLLETIDVAERLRLVSAVPREADRGPRAEGQDPERGQVRDGQDPARVHPARADEGDPEGARRGRPGRRRGGRAAREGRAVGHARRRQGEGAQGGRPAQPDPERLPEKGVIRTYVDWLVSLPWGVDDR